MRRQPTLTQTAPVQVLLTADADPAAALDEVPDAAWIAKAWTRWMVRAEPGP